MNRLFYGDNLDVMRRYIEDESVDLVYLDPPFNSNASYNVLFAEHDGTKAASQIKAFEDTWEWNEDAARAFEEVVEAGGRTSQAMQAFRTLLGESDMMAYLAMMAPRFVELRRVLKPTGSIYLHCDPTASHYLKMLLDAVFRPQNFRNEVIWKRSHAHSDAKQGAKHLGRVTDTLLFYAKDSESTWNVQFVPYSQEYIDRDYRRADADGRRFRIDNLQGPGGAAKGNPYYEVMGVKRHWRYSKERMAELIRQGRIVQTRPGAVPQYKRYLDEMPGVPLQNLWADLPVLNNRSKEVLGYQTQKPQALLERIIAASSNEWDVVLDPFCGCGTTIAAAQKLNRRWIGIDITHIAIALIRHRLRDSYGDSFTDTYEVIGEPVSLEDAATLAEAEPYQFQAWALGLVGARPAEGIRKGADKGVDGRIYFHEGDGTTRQIVISVKAGKLHAPYVRDLRGVVEREKAALGVLLALDEPTKAMRTEAASAGFYKSPWGQHPRVQIVTVGELLAGKRLDAPPPRQTSVTYRRAPKAMPKEAEQQPSLPSLYDVDADIGKADVERRKMAKATLREAKKPRARRSSRGGR